MKFNKNNILYLLFALCVLASCSASKFVEDGHYILKSVEVKTDSKELDANTLKDYIRQKGNSKWFSLFKIPLGTYALAGTDTTKWINRTLKNIGEEPVIYDTLQAKLSCEDLKNAMQNMGYMHSSVKLETKTSGKSIKAIYHLYPGIPYYIDNIRYNIEDSLVAKLLNIGGKGEAFVPQLKKGSRFTVDALDGERKRITNYLLERGYYRFHKDYIQYSADSSAYDNKINIVLNLYPYRTSNNSPAEEHPRYTIRKINYLSGDTETIPFRKKVLENATIFEEGEYFNNKALQQTYNKFARLGAIRYTNITFNEVPDSNLLDCSIQVSTNKPNMISFQPEGTNTAGDLGAAATLTYENRNLFHGSELLSIQLRGAFEAIKGLEGYQNQDYIEYNVEGKLQFPRFLAPLLSRAFVRRSNATSELSAGYNLQNRPEFHRRVFSAAWRYRWSDVKHHLNFRLDLLDMNYVYMPWISETFKHDYLESESNRNAILKYNYEDLFIMKIGFGLSYNTNSDAFKANVETSGNILNALAHGMGFHKNANGQYTFLNIAYAQYFKFDFDYTHLFQFDSNNSLATHIGFGVAWPYGNSTILPFEKRYFSGGANSVRGWSVRGLGPGKFRGTDGRIDFINQTGDMKLDMNMEYRTKLFWKFDGAAFVDAGNIWTLRNYAEQPGGQFKLGEFYKQIAASYGLGLRLNFDYFILRFDMGMKAINPAYETEKEHWPIIHPVFSRDFTFHFAVGLPF